MKSTTTKKLAIFIFSSLLLCSLCQASEITFVVNNVPGEDAVILTNSITIKSNEVLEVVNFYKSGFSSPYCMIQKDGITFKNSGGIGRVVGPAVFSFNANPFASGGSDTKGFVTVRIEPESFPPGQTLIVPQGTGAIVHMESSTNLVSWTNEWTQSFTNSPDHRFFRLTAERLP